MKTRRSGNRAFCAALMLALATGGTAGAPEDFRALVDRFLDGKRIDFRTRDRFQMAMAVVQELERRLPLPPFEVWVEDFMAHADEYARYSHRLHRESELGLPDAV